MIDINRKLLFVHIPKCAGTFIEKNLTPNIDWHKIGEKHFSMQHCIDTYGKDVVSGCFKFSVVRNPYSRLLSFFLYHKRKNTSYFKINAFEKNLRKFKKDYQRNFSSFIFNLKNYHHKLESWAKNDLRPCHDFFTNFQGIEIDLILKQENLAEDLEKLQAKTNLFFKNERINAAPSAYDLLDFYKNSEIEFVKEYYKTDFFYYYPNLDL
ncbi:MAG: sulfotransferase family protein [Paraglaciecola sp.]|uniref:sulfotransferase family 2 domain-containing protein n=1 Tax=Paraglaciecola sp. TaxID=1920173 RepID=UPI00273DE9D2|nr:sulfotransferase family 2 domain-containing protein [Paraglaciecola sp.]MDP5030744.1 sulfotransferase family protein [Paraglaciecola sp.]MDP5132306.1 sulfotransferase family protein [Paraglaciecola sp.]